MREANFKLIQNVLESEGIEDIEQDIPQELANQELICHKEDEQECMGLCLSCPQRDKLDCGITGGKNRGIKSLAELRLKDGFALDQNKITTMLNAGKGKILPKET